MKLTRCGVSTFDDDDQIACGSTDRACESAQRNATTFTCAPPLCDEEKKDEKQKIDEPTNKTQQNKAHQSKIDVTLSNERALRRSRVGAVSVDAAAASTAAVRYLSHRCRRPSHVRTERKIGCLTR
jgi:hypothetical protein